MPRNLVSLFGSDGDVLPASSGPIETNRIVWYRKSTGRSTTQWDDSSGNANHLTMTGTPTVNGDGGMTYDGVDDRGTSTVALTVPYTVYFRCQIDTWTSGAVMCDANQFGNVQFTMQTSTPQVGMIHQFTLGPYTGMTVGDYASICLMFNGASSIVRINGTENSGNAGTSAGTGICIGSDRSSAAFANWSVTEAIYYTGTHDSGQRTSQIAYLDTL